MPVVEKRAEMLENKGDRQEGRLQVGRSEGWNVEDWTAEQSAKDRQRGT